MKPIAIKPENAERIDAAIAEVERAERARVRKLTYSNLQWGIKNAEGRLSILPKRLWTGAVITINPHAIAAKSYRGWAYGTEAVVARRGNGWTLIKVRRATVPTGQGRSDNSMYSIQLPDMTDADFTREVKNRMGIWFSAPKPTE